MMASMLNTFLAQDITDSTDFPDDATTPGLRSFDDALRCPICRDFYDAPVSLTCGHCFCSACIRSALPEQGLCPACRKPASESQIRRVVAVETAVHAWKAARELILRYACEEEKRKAQPIAHARPTRRQSSNSNHSERAGQKRRRRNSPLSPSSDDEVIAIPSSPVPSGSSTPDVNFLPDLVACPVCEKDVPSSTINMHLDSGCKKYLFEGSTSTSNNAGAESSKSKQRQQWSHLLAGSKGKGPSTKAKDRDKGKSKAKGKSRATPMPDVDVTAEDAEPLPKVAYDIHPQKRIAEMLADCGLPTHGDKNALIRRHARWVVLYNANIDRDPKHRHTLEQLRQELKTEEVEGRTRKESVEDAIAYQRANKAAFAKLTEAARPKKVSKAEAKEVELVPVGDAAGDPEAAKDSSPAPGHQFIDVDDS